MSICKIYFYCNVRLSPFVKGFGPPIRVCDPMGPSRYTSPRVETLTYATEINFAKVLIYFVYLCGHYDFNREFNS